MTEQPSTAVELADTASDLMYGLAGWLLIFLGVVAFLSSVSGFIQASRMSGLIVSLLILVFAFVFLSTGVLVNPRFRRRLNRRHELSKFGRVQTVDSRVFESSERRKETCVCCGSRMTEGLIRRYREEYVVAGLPVWTSSENYNYYCRYCGINELSASSRSPADGGWLVHKLLLNDSKTLAYSIHHPLIVHLDSSSSVTNRMYHRCCFNEKA